MYTDSDYSMHHFTARTDNITEVSIQIIIGYLGQLH